MNIKNISGIMFTGSFIVLLSAVLNIYCRMTEGWDAPLRLTGSVDEQLAFSEGWKISEVSLEKPGCCGRCPIYSISFKKNGFAKYDGKAFVEKLGTYHGYAYWEFRYLTAWIEMHNIMNLKQVDKKLRYRQEGTRLNIVINGKQNEIIIGPFAEIPIDLWPLST